jgi:hypothetical protein
MIGEVIGFVVGVLMAFNHKSAARDHVDFQRHIVPTWIRPGTQRRAELGYLVGGLLLAALSLITLLNR